MPLSHPPGAAYFARKAFLMNTPSTRVDRAAYEVWRENSAEERQRVAADPDRLAFHIQPEAGWMNDPNGLVQVNGTYHIYHQYNPFDAARGAATLWNHLSTQDFVHYRDHGPALFPDSELDASGAYSGSAFVEHGNGEDATIAGKSNRIHYFYTGNVKHTDRDDYDYVLTGREANQIHLVTNDPCELGEKRVVLTNADYPADIGCHVRDPKILEHAGVYYMVLGARTRDDNGCVLVYTSRDLDHWTYATRIALPKHFGFMWECPDLFFLDGELVLVCCPQGVPAEGLDYHNAHQCVAFRVQADFAEQWFTLVDDGRPRMFDHGFDFYAPQSFEDEQGRRIAFGWIGLPDPDYDNPTVPRGWQGALTVPRELHLREGKLVQQPVAEMEALRGEKFDLASGERLDEPGRVFELLVSCNGAKKLKLNLRAGVELTWQDGVLTLDMTGDGHGRTVRSAALDRLDDLRILSDTSVLEIFANGGETVFTTRTYSAASVALTCKSDAQTQVAYYQLGSISMDRSN